MEFLPEEVRRNILTMLFPSVEFQKWKCGMSSVREEMAVRGLQFPMLHEPEDNGIIRQYIVLIWTHRFRLTTPFVIMEAHQKSGEMVLQYLSSR